MKLNKRKIIISAISLIITVFAFSFLIKIERASTTKETQKIVVAVKEIQKGDTITGDLLKEIDHEGKLEFNYVKSKGEIENLVATEKIFPEEPINKARVTKNESVLVKKENRKEYSLKLNIEDAVAGSLRAGDLVKIIGTQALSATEITTDYVIKENNTPKSIRILSVYDAGGKKIKTEDIPAGVYVLDVSEEEAVILDKAIASQKIKLVKD